MGTDKSAYIEKHSGFDGCLLDFRETVLSVDELREAIRVIWPARAESYDPNGSVVIKVWDSVPLKKVGVDPQYLFIFRPIKRA